MKKTKGQKGKKILQVLIFIFGFSLPYLGYGGCGFLSQIPNICKGGEIHFNDYTNMNKPTWILKRVIGANEVNVSSGNDDFSYTFSIAGKYRIYLMSYASITTCQGIYMNTFQVYDKLDGVQENLSVCRNGPTVWLEYYRNQYGWLAGGTWSGTGVSGDNFIPSSVPGGTSSITLDYNLSLGGCSSTNNLVITINDLPIVNFTSAFPTLWQSDPAINILPYTDAPTGGWVTGYGMTYPDLFSPNTAPGNISLTLHYQDPTTGCYNDPISQDITVNADLGYPPPAEISFYTLVHPLNIGQFLCDGDSVFIQVTDFDTSNYSYNIEVNQINQFGQISQLYSEALNTAYFSFLIPDDGINNDINIIVSNTNIQGKTTNKKVIVHSKAIPQNPTFVLSSESCIFDSDVLEINRNYENMYKFYWNFDYTFLPIFDSSDVDSARKYKYNNDILNFDENYFIRFNNNLCKNINISVYDSLPLTILKYVSGSYVAENELLYCSNPISINQIFSKTPEEPNLRFYDISDTSGTRFYVADGETFDVKINNYNSNYQYQEILYRYGNLGVIDTLINIPINSQIFSITIPDDSLNNIINLSLVVVNTLCGNCQSQKNYSFLTHNINALPNFAYSDSSCVSGDSVLLTFSIDSNLFGYYHIYDYYLIPDSSFIYQRRKIIINETDTIQFGDSLYVPINNTGITITARYLDFCLDLYSSSPGDLRLVFINHKTKLLHLFKTPAYSLRFYDISDTSGTRFYVADGESFDVKINNYNPGFLYNEYTYSFDQYGVLDTLVYGQVNSQIFSITIPDDSLNNIVGLTLTGINPNGMCENIQDFIFNSHALAPVPVMNLEDSTCAGDTVFLSAGISDDYLGNYFENNFSLISDTSQVISIRKIIINNADTISLGDSSAVLLPNLVNYISTRFLDVIPDWKDSLNYRMIYVPGREKNLILFHNPNVDFSVTDNNLFEGQLVQFTNFSQYDDGYNYIYWSFGDGSYSYEDNPWHYYYVSGNKDVTLTINNLYQCQNTSTKYAYITVNSNATNPINTQSQEEIRIFQYNNDVVIYLPDGGYRYQLFTITGKMIQQGNLMKGINKESISKLPSGIYFARVVGKEIITKKIMKK